MENRDYDQDEILIRQVLTDSFPKNFRISEGAIRVKPKRMLRKGFVMSFIVSCLVVVTVSAAHYMGAFERLTALIGQERADELTPVEIGYTDEIAVKLVAMELGGDVAFIYFTMQDLIGNRLDEDFTIFHTITPMMPIDDFMVSIDPPEIIHRDENGVVTFRSRFLFSHDLDGVSLEYAIREIRFADFRHPLQVVDINLAEFASPAPTALLQTKSPALSAGGMYAEDITSRYAEIIMGEGLPVLAPHMLDKCFAIEGVQAYISSIGVVNGRFHIQTHVPNMRRSSINMLLLHKSDAGVLDVDDLWHLGVPDLFTAQFSMNADGSPGREFEMPDTYFEVVYDIDIDRIHEYVLAVTGFGSERIDINWSVRFYV